MCLGQVQANAYGSHTWSSALPCSRCPPAGADGEATGLGVGAAVPRARRSRASCALRTRRFSCAGSARAPGDCVDVLATEEGALPARSLRTRPLGALRKSVVSPIAVASCASCSASACSPRGVQSTFALTWRQGGLCVGVVAGAELRCAAGPGLRFPQPIDPVERLARLRRGGARRSSTEKQQPRARRRHRATSASASTRWPAANHCHLPQLRRCRRVREHYPPNLNIDVCRLRACALRSTRPLRGSGGVFRAQSAPLRPMLSAFEGREIDRAGEGLLAVLRRPEQSDQGSAQEVGARAGALGLGLRGGVHVGEAEVDGSRVRGVAVHAAARICALAQSGEVLVSSTVRDLVAGAGFSFDDRGIHELRGVPEPRHRFAVLLLFL